MATTNIELDIENITGVSDADDQFIISAQKFVVASVPKNLLLFASKQSSTYTGGSGIAASIDSVVEVQRNGYSCKQIPISESKWAADSTSLKYATSKHPVWWFDSSVIKILPEPSGSEDGYYYYIDYSEIDDDSDLRNAVINYACSKEFSKLAGSTVFPSLVWGKETPPAFTPPILQQPDWSDVENWITTEEDSEMLTSRVQAIQSQIAEYQAKLQSSQAEFNSELQDYQARLNETVQLNQGQIAEWQSENSVKLNHYIQMSAQHYNWAKAEIESYIQNNSRMINRAIAAQASRQQARR